MRPTKRDIAQRGRKNEIQEQTRELDDATPMRTDQEERALLERLQQFKPDLEGNALLEAVNYIPIMSERQLFQAATYSAAYGFSFPTAAKLVLGGFDYKEASQIWEIVKNTQMPVKDAKGYVKLGYDPNKVYTILNLERMYGVEHNEALRMIQNFGDIADKIAEAGWRPYQNKRRDEGTGFATIKSKKGWLIFEKTTESDAGLLEKIADKEELQLSELSPGSNIYFVTTDVAETRQHLQNDPVSQAKNNIAYIKPEITKKQRDEGDEHAYEHMATTRLSSDRI